LAGVEGGFQAISRDEILAAVRAGLDPAIHRSWQKFFEQMDRRIKSGDDAPFHATA
jgi:hypothetical protein